ERGSQVLLPLGEGAAKRRVRVNRVPPSPRALVSKLAETEARVLLPLGEGGPKGRMRVHFLPSPGASRHPLPRGEGHPRNRFPNRESHETCISPASGTNHISYLDKSASSGICTKTPRWACLFPNLKCFGYNGGFWR